MSAMRRMSLVLIGLATTWLVGVPTAGPAGADEVAPSFTSSTAGSTGNGPYSVAIGDLDGDGDQDLATANHYSGTVSILTRGPGGSYTTTSVPTGSGPFSVAIGDLDGDGDQDLATANSRSNTVSILTRGPGGSYTTTTAGPTGNNPYSVAIGDLDGDGDQDLTTADFDSRTVTILTNRSPTFTVAPSSASFTSTRVGGTSSSQTITVTNTGDRPLTISDASPAGADANQFEETSDNCTGVSLAPNATCTVTVRFAPTRAGTHDAALRFTHDAVSSPDDVPLRGTGRAALAADGDQDGVADSSDNCPTMQNPNQADADGDGIGNVCESPAQRDDDNDGVFSPNDNCTAIANPGQRDSDGDGVGDACERTSGGGGQPGTDETRINPIIKGKNTRTGDDKLTVRAKAANGAGVRIFRINGKHRRELVDQGRLNANGVYKSVINDINRRRQTAYKAVVYPTADTQRGATDRLQQR
jgi:hypothetical protein